jgi:type IV pilus assembly protein PilE
MGKQHSTQRGFTLIELMVVVVVIGILAAIGYPSYTDYIRRGKVAEATSTLSDVRNKMETFYLDNRTYVGSDAANLPCNATVLNTGKKYFTYDCATPAPTAGAYTITAVGNATEGMGGFTYTITEQNVRASTVTGVTGWSGNATCWVTKKGGIC